MLTFDQTSSAAFCFAHVFLVEGFHFTVNCQQLGATGCFPLGHSKSGFCGGRELSAFGLSSTRIAHYFVGHSRETCVFL